MEGSVFVIVNSKGERVWRGYGKAVKVFVSRGHAVNRCPKGCRVVELKIANGEVIHEG